MNQNQQRNCQNCFQLNRKKLSQGCWILSSQYSIKVKTLNGHSDQINALTLSQDSSYIISGSSDHTVRVQDLESGQCILVLYGQKSSVHSVAISKEFQLKLYLYTEMVLCKDCTVIISGGMDGVVVLQKEETQQSLQGHLSKVNSLALSDDSKMIVSGSQDCTVRMWSVSSGECLRVLIGHTREINSVLFSNDVSMIISGSADHIIRVWVVESGDCLRIFEGHDGEVNSVALTNDSTIIVSGSLDGSVRTWSMTSGDCLRVLNGHENSVLIVKLNKESNKIVSGSNDQIVRVWQIASGICLNVFRGFYSKVQSLTLNGESTVQVSECADFTINVIIDYGKIFHQQSYKDVKIIDSSDQKIQMNLDQLAKIEKESMCNQDEVEDGWSGEEDN